METRTRQKLVKIALFAAMLVPLVKLGVDALRGGLGVDPVAEVENRLGFWTLTTLLLTLAMTPLNRTLGWTWPLRVRRMLGLFAFFYATLHLASYLAIDQGFDFSAILDDVEKRKFITVGLAAFVLLLPLALTSTNGWTKRLGAKRWKALHRLVYVAAALGLFHFAWRFKVLEDLPVVFAAVFSMLMLVRVGVALGKRARAGRRAAARLDQSPAPEA